MRRQGIGAELKIGTRLETEFHAHAWVEYEGFVVGERQGVKVHYVAFDKLETKLSQNLSIQSNKLTPISRRLIFCTIQLDL